ncbi:MAG: YbaN family protein [Ignavibacteriae bacterium]|nr:YbaN family protein [Ignavibacteriota bacterium]
MEKKTKLQLDVKENRLIRYLWIFFGFLMVAMGILGAVLPVIPGTIFFIIAAFCFAKSSEKFYKMLIHNKYVGQHLQNYLEEKFIPVKTKIIIISSIWISMTASAVYVLEVLWQRLIMFAIAIGVSVYIIRHRSKRSSETENGN